MNTFTQTDLEVIKMALISVMTNEKNEIRMDLYAKLLNKTLKIRDKK